MLDYGCVLTPDIFESKKSFSDARNEFAKTIKKYFGDSSFYKNTGNENYVARSYMMAKKMCENSQFSDITDIYACDMDVVSHTYGYDSSNIILLADTQVVQLNDSYGQDCDTDQDGILDYKEAHTAEEVDITSFLEVYCKYNKYSEEEKNEMLLKNSKVVMYNYSSNPVLPDSDFDGRDDLRDGKKLDNEYNSINETDNYSNVKIKFNQDYRYFFMDSTKYYEELAEMGLVLSNMASKKKKNNIYVNKSWRNMNSGEQYISNSINDYMWYIGMDNIVDHMEEEVPYIIGQHDTIGLLGKVNNLERNVITLVIGENENYKNILAANYDGTLDKGSGNEIHHQGYDYYADKIYEQLINYDNKQNADRWKKSYWITGYGTGGAIANLVAKKFIDYKHVNTNVYCYTYQAPGTINRSNISSGNKIHNTKYYSIFNHINIDDPLVFLEGDNFDRYGRDKKVAAGYTNDFHNKNEFSKDIICNSLNESLVILLMDYELNNEVNGMIKGFSFVDDFRNLKNNIDILKNILLIKSKLESSQIITNVLTGETLIGWLKAKIIHNKYINAILSSIDLKYQKEVIEDDDEIQEKPEVLSEDHIKVGATLKYLDELAVWYINHVATYGSKMKGKDYNYYDDATTPAKNYLKDYANVDETNNIYTLKYISDALITINNIQSPTAKDGRLGYKYDKLYEYAEDNGDNELDKIEIATKEQGKRRLLRAGYVGDDCNSFSLAIIRLLAEGKRGQDGILETNGGIDLQNTYASKMMSDPNFDNSMLNLGFHKYYLNETEWYHKYIKDGVVEDNKTSEVEGINFLQPGDMLVCNGHVEFYNGFKYTIEFKDKREGKKSGIESITRGEKLKPGINNNDKDTNEKGRAYGTFGWGRVRDVYPSEAEGDGDERNTYFYFTFNANTKMFELHYSSSSPGQTTYKTIWRK